MDSGVATTRKSQLATHHFLILPYVHTSIRHAVIRHSYESEEERLTRGIVESGGATGDSSSSKSCHN
jgi:hypothetical protein